MNDEISDEAQLREKTVGEWSKVVIVMVDIRHKNL